MRACLGRSGHAGRRLVAHVRACVMKSRTGAQPVQLQGRQAGQPLPQSQGRPWQVASWRQGVHRLLHACWAAGVEPALVGDC